MIMGKRYLKMKKENKMVLKNDEFIKKANKLLDLVCNNRYVLVLEENLNIFKNIRKRINIYGILYMDYLENIGDRRVIDTDFFEMNAKEIDIQVELIPLMRMCKKYVEYEYS